MALVWMGSTRNWSGRGEVAFGFQVETGQTLIVEHALGGFVAIERNDVVIGGLDGRRFAGALQQRAANGGGLEESGPGRLPARQPDSRSAAGRITFILVEYQSSSHRDFRVKRAQR